ncbi:MAG: hypothetical protein HQL72_02170 [Magnetococcales bacterium]|nr:hypothetical protein [Magnetococcales bacterium]
MINKTSVWVDVKFGISVNPEDLPDNWSEMDLYEKQDWIEELVDDTEPFFVGLGEGEIDWGEDEISCPA